MCRVLVRNILLPILVLVVLVTQVSKSVAEDVSLATLYLNYLPHRLTLESGKQYDLFVEEVLEGVADRPSFEITPLQRGKHVFLADDKSCLFPSGLAVVTPYQKAETFKISEPVDHLTFRLYTKETGRENAKLEDFEPSRLGFINGAGAARSLGDRASEYFVLSSEQQLIAMLELGRIDAFIGHHPDTAIALDDFGKPGLLYATDFVIDDILYPISFVCHNNPAGAAFVEHVNVRIRDMKNSGRLREILGPHAEIHDRRASESTSVR